jgi:hypothetical protein
MNHEFATPMSVCPKCVEEKVQTPPSAGIAIIEILCRQHQILERMSEQEIPESSDTVHSSKNPTK